MQKEYSPRELLNLLDYRHKHERLRYFNPNSAQQRWIDEISRPGAFIVVAGAGNGAGKTFGIVGVLGAFIWPDIAPKGIFGAEIFQNFKGPKRARLISTPKELEEIGSIQTTIKELWPDSRYVADKKGKSFFSVFSSSTGWIIDLMSFEQSVAEFAGANIGVAIFNEPPPEDIFKETLARLRNNGICLMAMTSLNENAWVVDGLLSKANGKDIRVVYGDIEDNCRDHGKNGVLEHSQIEKILNQYDPDEREARKTGKPLRFSGRVLKSFDRSVHVSKSDIIPDADCPHFMVVDPAIGKPLAVIWAFLDKTGVINIYDEWPEVQFEGAKDSNMTVGDYAKLFKSREAGRSIETRIIDRHFANARRTVGGLTLKQEFAEHELYFIDSYKMDPAVEVETGILKIKEYLSYDASKPIDSLNRPRLMISPRCLNVIASMERWSRDPKTSKPQERHKDFADCVRYLLESSPEASQERAWVEPERAFYGVGREKSQSVPINIIPGA